MLTTLATLKARLKIETTDVVDDTALTNLIKLVSGRFDVVCNRTFARGSGVTFEFSAEAMEIVPCRCPIESVSAFAIKNSEEDGWEAVENLAYLVRKGCVISLSAPLGTDRQQGRVTYTGGYVNPGTTPGAGQTALPDELQFACVEQCAALWQGRDRLGLTSVQGAGGTVQSYAQFDLLPGVKATLMKYERYVL